MASVPKACPECGSPVSDKRATALFCSNPCRQAFNRRRRDRGAELYDFVMAGDDATVKSLRAAYKNADASARGGRRSWQDRDTALLNIPAAYGTDGDKR
jgi:predicted nucleic acid-binding Zn ribbon protein